jgi:hypothetical protein
MIKLIPFTVTDNDYWLSFPLEGLTRRMLMLGIQQYTSFHLYQKGVKVVLDTVAREQGKPCKYCSKRATSRLFLILTPQDNYRLRGFVVCETCADHMKAEVAA